MGNLCCKKPENEYKRIKASKNYHLILSLKYIDSHSNRKHGIEKSVN